MIVVRNQDQLVIDLSPMIFRIGTDNDVFDPTPVKAFIRQVIDC